MSFEVATVADIVLLSACSFLGNIGKAVTGFGMAIVFLFVWNIVDLLGYDGDFKYAVFIQSLALMSVQPLALWNASVVKNSFRKILYLFVPVTLVSTPLGNLLAEYVPTKTIQAVAGVLVGIVAVWEMYSKRKFFLGLCGKEDDAEGREGGGEGSDATKEAKGDEAKASDLEGGENKQSTANDFEDNPKSQTQADESELKTSESQTGHVEGGTESKVENSKEDEDEDGAASVGAGDGRKGGGDGEEFRIGPNRATIWTLLAGGASGFLGGLVAIRGPPLIFYFLHPPAPVSFNKTTQRATASTITFFNVTMRQIFYLYNTFAAAEQIGYRKEEWRLYLSVIAASVMGAMVGNWIFAYLKDSKDTIRAILSVFLLLSATGLLFSAFR